MKKHYFLAFDLGAESGRAVLGILENQRLLIEELYRFPNSYVEIDGHLHWDVNSLLSELKKGLSICSHIFPDKIESLGVDTWGVDFGLLNNKGNLISLPYSYRDPQTDGVIKDFSKRIMPLDKLYSLTGIQTMQINTLFQLFAIKNSNPELISEASYLLFMPDLINYFLTGEKKTEYSIATTSQLLDPFTRKWNKKLFDAAGIPENIMQEVIPEGSIYGNLRLEICKESGIKQIPVISVASHDTGSAIVAIPADENWAYLSSGTWSLMGIEVSQPIINDVSCSQNFTNEGGVEGSYRFLKNMCGLWLLQQCKKVWDTEKEYSYIDLVELAKVATPFKSLIDIDSHEFLNPPDMVAAISDFCRNSNQPQPESIAEYVRCIFESMVLKYRLVMRELKKFSPFSIRKLYIIGGGAKNCFLCQLTANALNMPVITGPPEASAIGNILIQARTLGQVSSLAGIREIVKNSFESSIYYPKVSDVWETQEMKMVSIISYLNLKQTE